MKKFNITVEYAQLTPCGEMWDVIDFEHFESYGEDKQTAFNNVKKQINEYTFKHGYDSKSFDKTWYAREIEIDADVLLWFSRLNSELSGLGLKTC